MTLSTILPRPFAPPPPIRDVGLMVKSAICTDGIHIGADDDRLANAFWVGSPDEGAVALVSGEQNAHVMSAAFLSLEALQCQRDTASFLTYQGDWDHQCEIIAPWLNRLDELDPLDGRPHCAGLAATRVAFRRLACMLRNIAIGQAVPGCRPSDCRAER